MPRPQASPTPTQQLAEHLIGAPMTEWLGERRAAGISWRRIALELRDRTGGVVDVTSQALINWAERAA